MATFAEVWIQLLPTAEGGRSSPIFLGPDGNGTYRPHLRVRDGDGEYLGVQFVGGPEGPVRPGDVAAATVRFTYEPAVDYSALQLSAEFEIMEGGKAVGVGSVTTIWCAIREHD